MNKKRRPKETRDWSIFSKKIGADTERKLKARRNKAPGVWSGLGMMGLIGWSVAVPTLAGAALGVWLDDKTNVEFSWTLTLIIVGLTAGCLNAWHWLSKEGRDINEEQEEKDE